MKKTVLLLVFTIVLLPKVSRALDGVYVGGQLGHVGLLSDLSNQHSNALGLGLDLGVRTDPILDVVFRIGYSSHSGGPGLTILSSTVSADYHFAQINDFEFTAGIGPGFYLFDTGSRRTNFGVNAGGSADVVIDDFRVGLGTRFHALFNSGTGSGSYWTITMRFGFLFPVK